MKQFARRYPVGMQTFEKIREGNYVYIDKTAFVYRMAHEALEQIDSKLYTLKYAMDSRPVYKIGVNFSTATRMPNEWLIVEA